MVSAPFGCHGLYIRLLWSAFGYAAFLHALIAFSVNRVPLVLTVYAL